MNIFRSVTDILEAYEGKLPDTLFELHRSGDGKTSYVSLIVTQEMPAEFERKQSNYELKLHLTGIALAWRSHLMLEKMRGPKRPEVDTDNS